MWFVVEFAVVFFPVIILFATCVNNHETICIPQASAALAEMTPMATPMTMGTGPSISGGWPRSQNLKKWWLMATHHNWSQVLSYSKEIAAKCCQIFAHKNYSWVFVFFVLFQCFYFNYILETDLQCCIHNSGWFLLLGTKSEWCVDGNTDPHECW